MLKPSYAAPETAEVVGLKPWIVALLVLTGVAALGYFPWRANVLHPAAPLYSALVYAAEWVLLCGLAARIYLFARILRRDSAKPLAGLTADMFIIAGDASAAALRKTIAAAKIVRGAPRLFLLDRKARPAIAALAEELGVVYAPAGDAEASFGRMCNHALAGSEADIIALVDGAEAPTPDFLDATLGYFHDRNVAFVQANRGVHGEPESAETAVLDGARDYRNATPLNASAALLRRQALRVCGGFADEGDDDAYHTGLRLHRLGFGSVHHGGAIAFAETRREVSRRSRLAVWKRESFLFGAGLSFGQRIAYAAPLLAPVIAAAGGMILLAPAIAAASGIVPVTAIDAAFLARFAPWAVLAAAAHYLTGRGKARTLDGLPASALFATLLLGAAALGLVRYATAPHMPLADFAAAVALTVAASALVLFAMARQARRPKARRASYRFAAPLPLDVQLPTGGRRALRLIDISTSGLSFAAPMGLDFAIGAKLDAQLHLPDRAVPLKLRIRHRTVRGGDDLPLRLEVGCATLWESSDDADAIAAFLNGSMLDRSVRAQRAPRAWAAGAIDGAEIALQPLGQDEWRIFSFAPLSEDAEILAPTNGGAETPARLNVIESAPIPAGGGRVYLSRVRLTPAAPARAG